MKNNDIEASWEEFKKSRKIIEGKDIRQDGEFTTVVSKRWLRARIKWLANVVGAKTVDQLVEWVKTEHDKIRGTMLEVEASAMMHMLGINKNNSSSKQKKKSNNKK